MPEPTIPLDQLRDLLVKLREAQARTDERAKVTHERFNVFTTLLEAHDEVRLHTRFLCCLLNPEGYHDCKSLFLDLFFEMLAKQHGEDNEGKTALFEEITSDKPPWRVENEASRHDFGRIDILLEQTSFGIAIENKIYAGEQPSQIERYAKYLEGRFHARSNWRVIYLTLHGEKSEKANGMPYLRISYEKHILAWLDKCLEKTYHIVPINQVLLQYRKVVRDLTGKTIMSEYVKPIVEFITNHTDIIHFRKQIDEGINEACAAFLNGLANGIIEELPKTTSFSVAWEKQGANFSNSKDCNMLLTPPPNNVLFNAPFTILVQNDTSTYGYLLIGIVPKHWPIPPELQAEHQSLFKIMEGQFRTDGNEKHIYEYCGGYFPTGWRILEPMDDESMAKLIPRLPETISNVCADIISYIALLEKIYTDLKQPTKTQL